MTPTYFNDEEDERLVKLVQSQNFLWNLKNPDFRKKVKREAAWKVIAKELNKPRLEVQKRWKSIRDHYRRQVREEASGTCTKKRASYYPLMQFIDNENEDADQSIIVEELPLSVSMDFNNIPTTFAEADLQENISEVHQSFSKRYSEPPAKKQKTAFSSLMQHLADNEEDRGQFRRFLQDLMSSPQQEDEIDVFFKSMAMSVKKFSPQLITQTKMKVCQLVMEMEALNQKR